MADLKNHLSKVTVFSRGWRNPQLVEVAGLVAASGVNAPETLSAILPARGQTLTGVDWLGKWVTWEHPTFGLVSGWVKDMPIAGDRGTLELAATGFVDLLSKRRTFRRYRPASGPPGAIVSRALVDVVLDIGMPVVISASERGPQLHYEFRADSVMDVMQSMVSASGQEWRAWLDASRTLRIDWRAQVGGDATRTVTYTEGINVISAQIDATLQNSINDLLAVADDQQFARAQGARIISAGSRASYGRMQGTRHYVGVVSPATLGPRASKDLKTLSLPTVTVTLRVPHLDWRLSYLRDGTRFRFVSASANAVYTLRVLARDVDLDAGVVTLTCDAQMDITRATKQAYDQYGGIATMPD